MRDSKVMPWGYRWRSSSLFITATICVALFSEVFLYGFLVPILPSMLEQRLHVDPSETQRFTSISLALNGLASVFGGPLIGHFADKAQDRRTPLLVALFGCIIGTGMVACATSLAMLFAGRALQGVSGSGAWIVGIATAADTVSDDDFGKVMGFIMSCVNAGIITGPTVSGLIFETAGYWLTWSVPVVILIIDIVARLLMIETPRNSSAKGTETESLLSPQDSEHVPVERNFWSVMLTDIRVITALLICVWGASLNTSLSATIPLYVQRTFEWGPARTGQLFLLLAVPGLIIGPLVGWLRDRVGTRLPATFTIALQSMALAFLGLVTISHYNGDGVDMQGQALYITCIAMLGLFKPGLDGNGPVELTAVVKLKEAQTPGIFGPRGGLSRVSAMFEVACTLGMTIGPMISGGLVERFRYSIMAWSFSAASIIFAVLAFCFLGDRKKDKEARNIENTEERQEH